MQRSRSNPPRRSDASADAPPCPPLAVSFLGTQKLDLPAISYWRNNVVALSQHYNLLFVAVRSAIHVYRPAFPNQRIPASGPYIILESEPSTNRPGFIDATHPHGINSLTIGELGHAEVLVSAHDNGDVCVWYTAEIESPRTGHPRIAIRRHVRESAWGVAIHPQRRLLAVSANSAEITVFELGMERDEVRDALSEETADKTSKRKTLRARTRRLKAPPFMGPSGMNEYSLIGHNNNIPNISFLPDSSGRWLVGVGIDGMVLLWDVYATRPVEKCKLGFLHRGWSVLFLKPQSFKPVHSLRTALGCPPSKPMPTPAIASGVRTISTGYYGSLYNPPARARSGDVRVYDISPPLDNTDHSVADFETALLEMQVDEFSYANSEEEDDDDDNAASESDENATNTGQNTIHDGAAAPIPQYYPAHTTGYYAPAQAHDYAPAQASEYTPAQAPEYTPAELASASASGSWSHFSRSRSASSSRSASPPPPPLGFVFATTEHNAYLLRSAPLAPSVVCRNALYQTLPPASALAYLTNIDRLNMTCHVPHLSCVVAGSQKGRVGLFRLTRCKRTIPKDDSGLEAEEDEFTMRMEHTLPREGFDASTSGVTGGGNGSESGGGFDVHTRPAAALLGMAVAPIQGAAPSGRRCRLLLVYTDGSILAWELAPPPEEEEAVGAVVPTLPVVPDMVEGVGAPILGV